MVLFQNADVYAPRALGLQDVLLAGGRIAAIAPRLSPPPAGWPVEVVDLGGRRLLPGLVDVHTHLGGGGGEGGAHTRVPPVALTALTLAGVTTAVGLLGTDTTTRCMADLLAAARGLATFGLTALCYTGGYRVPPATLTGDVRADVVHVDRIVAVGEIAISDHRSSQPTFDELVRLAADAHVAGLMTGKAGLLHLHVGDGARGLELVRRALAETELPARVFHPTHVNRNRRLWEEVLAMHDAGPTFDITAFDADGDAPSGGQALAEWGLSGRDRARVTLSSDGGGCLPTFDADGTLVAMDVGRSASLLVAVREAVELGLPLADALAACTATPAGLFRLPTKGRVEVGRDADVLVVDDALRPLHLLAGGRWLLRDGAPTVHGPFEPRPAAG